MATNGAERYMARGVSASKEDVHNAIANVRPPPPRRAHERAHYCEHVV